jgi:hypothetical protein
MGLYKKNNSSHNSPSERITSAQEFVAILGFPDTDDTFLTRVEVPIHFSGIFSDRACCFGLSSCFTCCACVTSRSHHYKPISALSLTGRDWWM